MALKTNPTGVDGGMIALGDEIRCDQEEIGKGVAAGTLSLPTKKSIAHHMIQDWLQSSD